MFVSACIKRKWLLVGCFSALVIGFWSLQSTPNFDVEEAYKSSPVKFKSGLFSRLYGRVDPNFHNPYDSSGNFYLATQPSALRELGEINHARDTAMEQLKAITDEGLLMSHKQREAFQRLKAAEIKLNAWKQMRMDDHDRAESQAELLALDKQLETIEELRAGSKETADDIENEAKEKKLTLERNGKLVLIPKNTRVSVLDISDSYAKVRILDGKHRSKVLYMSSAILVVK